MQNAPDHLFLTQKQWYLSFILVCWVFEESDNVSGSDGKLFCASAFLLRIICNIEFYQLAFLQMKLKELPISQYYLHIKRQFKNLKIYSSLVQVCISKLIVMESFQLQQTHLYYDHNSNTHMSFI